MYDSIQAKLEVDNAYVIANSWKKSSYDAGFSYYLLCFCALSLLLSLLSYVTVETFAFFCWFHEFFLAH